MLNFNLLPFSGIADWESYRNKLIFKNEKSLKRYQKQRLDYICNYHCVDYQKTDLIKSIPESKKNPKYIVLNTSGSNSSIQRSYKFPIKEYKEIEKHHFWRIEKEYNLESNGVVIDCGYSSSYDMSEEYKDSFLEGPHKMDYCGLHNDLYILNYRRNTTSNSWVGLLDQIKLLKPKFFLCSPSQIETIYIKTNGKIKIDSIAISTRETLYPQTRKIGEKIFSGGVIDKMRCWDGGLGFYECKNKRKHIYDELCFVEETDEGIASTDFFNYNTPFIKYLNGDHGKISQGKCACGVYGNYFENFEGKIANAIKIGKYVFPGSLIVEDLNSLFKFGGCSSLIFTNSLLNKYGRNLFENTDIIYRIRQNSDESIDFYYYSEIGLSENQINMIKDALFFILYRQANENLSIFEKEKKFKSFAKSINIFKDLDLIKTKGSRNKSCCVESDVAIDKLQSTY